MQISTERLRQAVIDYYGQAVRFGFPEAMTDVEFAETATQAQLLEMAEDADLDPSLYRIEGDDLL